MAAFELVFLGTGAADWPLRPGADVRYDVNCVIRRTSSLLINGKYLICRSRAGVLVFCQKGA